MPTGCRPGIAVQGRSMCPPRRCGVAVAVATSAALLCIHVISPPWARAAFGSGTCRTPTPAPTHITSLFPFPVVHPILSWTGAPLHAPGTMHESTDRPEVFSRISYGSICFSFFLMSHHPPTAGKVALQPNPEAYPIGGARARLGGWGGWMGVVGPHGPAAEQSHGPATA